MERFDTIMTVWNRLEYTKRTIASFIESGAMRDCERFIIVDNRSTEEGMDAFLHDIYANNPSFSGKVWLLRRGKNDGWGTAVNDALGLSRAPYLLLTNNDVSFNPGFHHEMLETLKNDARIGILGAWRHTGHHLVRNGVVSERFQEMDNVPAVAWMMPKSAMQVVGMLPENGPCMTRGGNGEDSSYVGRMKQAGFLVGVPPVDLAVHFDGY